MLVQIRDYVKREQVVSLQQIAREFAIETRALQPMLDFWIRRHFIAVCEEKTPCQSSCFKCPSSTHIYYKYCATIAK